MQRQTLLASKRPVSCNQKKRNNVVNVGNTKKTVSRS